MKKRHLEGTELWISHDCGHRYASFGSAVWVWVASEYLTGEAAARGGPGGDCKAGYCLKTTSGMACFCEINIQLTPNRSAEHSCSQTYTLSELHLILKWPFIATSHRHTCALIMFFSTLICHTCHVDGSSWQRREAALIWIVKTFKRNKPLCA